MMNKLQYLIQLQPCHIILQKQKLLFITYLNLTKKLSKICKLKWFHITHHFCISHCSSTWLRNCPICSGPLRQRSVFGRSSKRRHYVRAVAKNCLDAKKKSDHGCHLDFFKRFASNKMVFPFGNFLAFFECWRK